MAADPLLGEISMFAGNFAPRGWAFCDGQLLPISSNQALFSLLGTTYGGDGRTTFALPDLRGRTPIGSRRGPGLSNYGEGMRGGQEVHVLDQLEMPSHSHAAAATSSSQGTANIDAKAILHADSTGATNDPNGKFIAKIDNVGPNQVNAFGSTADIQMNENAVTVTGTVDLSSIPTPIITVGNTGGSQAHNNMQPYLAINYIIALVGVFPSRS